jgi:hypothetical protein
MFIFQKQVIQPTVMDSAKIEAWRIAKENFQKNAPPDKDGQMAWLNSAIASTGDSNQRDWYAGKLAELSNSSNWSPIVPRTETVLPKAQAPKTVSPPRANPTIQPAQPSTVRPAQPSTIHSYQPTELEIPYVPDERMKNTINSDAYNLLHSALNNFLFLNHFSRTEKKNGRDVRIEADVVVAGAVSSQKPLSANIPTREVDDFFDSFDKFLVQLNGFYAGTFECKAGYSWSDSKNGKTDVTIAPRLVSAK